MVNRHHKLIGFSLLFVTLLGFALGTPHKAFAAESSNWQAGHIIDDLVFYRANSMGVADVQNFLNSKVPTCDTNGTMSSGQSNGSGGTYTDAQWGTMHGYPPPYTCLKNYATNYGTISGDAYCSGLPAANNQTAAQVFVSVAQSCQINPQVLIELTQKEQGLVTDDWPWPPEYTEATGYACPDSGGCNISQSGFINQVYLAARQFRMYEANPNNYNFVPGLNNIAYSPTTSCGSAQVGIVDESTASLYNYTPYQPDNAALANLYGSGDSCSSYGNRNFWRDFTDWFGPTLNQVEYAQANDGSAGQYLLYNGVKQPITSYNALLAWGVPRLPLQYFDPATLAAIPTTSNALSSYVTIPGYGSNYFIDNGNSYAVSLNMQAVWGNFDGTPLSSVALIVAQTLLTYQGNLSQFVANANSPNIYMVDGGQLSQVSSPTLLNALGASYLPIITLSDNYFDAMPQTGIVLTAPFFSSGGTDYVISEGTANPVDPQTANLLGFWTPDPVTSYMIALYGAGPPMHYLVRASNQSTIYLLGGSSGGKEAVTSMDVFNGLRHDANYYETPISPYTIALMPTGSNISTTMVSASGNDYVLNQGARQVPASLLASYGGSGNFTPEPASLINLQTSGSAATQFIKTPSSPGIFMISNGQRLAVTNLNLYMLMGGGNETDVSSSDLQKFPAGAMASNYVTNGTQNYLLDGSSRFLVPNSAAMESAWGLTNQTPVQIDQAVINLYSNSGTLSQNVQTQDGEFCFVDNDSRACATSAAMIPTWNLTNNVIWPSDLLLDYEGINRTGALSAFVTTPPGQQYSNTVFVMGKGTLWGITTPSVLANLGYQGSLTYVSPATIQSYGGLSKVFQGFLASDDAGNAYVIDGGAKRPIPASYQNSWLSTQTPSQLGSGFLQLIPNGSSVTQSVTSSNTGTVFAIKNGQLYGIPTYSEYINGGYAPFTSVTPALLNSINYAGTL